MASSISASVLSSLQARHVGARALLLLLLIKRGGRVARCVVCVSVAASSGTGVRVQVVYTSRGAGVRVVVWHYGRQLCWARVLLGDANGSGRNEKAQ